MEEERIEREAPSREVEGGVAARTQGTRQNA